MCPTPAELERLIPRHFARKPHELDDASRSLFEAFIQSLDKGEIRAAEKRDGQWRVNHWVKQGILLGFRLGSVVDFSVNEHFQFRDKKTYPPKDLSASHPSIRLVPGGSSVRRGAYLGPQVTLMPRCISTWAPTSAREAWSIPTRWSAPAPRLAGESI